MTKSKIKSIIESLAVAATLLVFSAMTFYLYLHEDQKNVDNPLELISGRPHAPPVGIEMEMEFGPGFDGRG